MFRVLAISISCCIHSGMSPYDSDCHSYLRSLKILGYAAWKFWVIICSNEIVMLHGANALWFNAALSQCFVASIDNNSKKIQIILNLNRKKIKVAAPSKLELLLAIAQWLKCPCTTSQPSNYYNLDTCCGNYDKLRVWVWNLGYLCM